MQQTRLRALSILCLSSFVLGLSACGSNFQTDSGSTTTLPESAYCGTAKTIAGSSYAVTGQARFKYRNLVAGASYTARGSAVTGWYLDYNFSTADIAFAEVHVQDSTGNIVQCGETDVTGNFSLLIPATTGLKYTLSVYSRAYNNNYQVSVLNDVNNNSPYSINSSFTVTNSAPDLGTIVAEADENVDANISGAAFNILNDVLKANRFLRAQAATAGFTVAPKVSIFWKAGFNPNSYRGYPDSPLSFYSPGQKYLYILGGIAGDVKTSDTDHFDDSVIMHEYGHFLEDVFGKSNSPGGSHNGNAIIDPRLGWSEGWANYIQAAIKTYLAETSGSSYIDTYGYKKSATNTSGYGQNIVFDLKADPSSVATYDAPGATSEGMFREVAISRALYKTTSSGTYSYGGATRNMASLPFTYVWQAFANGDTSGSPTINGFNSSAVHFRSMGLFNNLLDLIFVRHSVNETTWKSMLADERQPLTNSEYGINLVNGLTCSDVTMTPAINSSTSKAIACVPFGSPSCPQYAYASNQLKSNDFYLYCFDGSSNPNVSLTYAQDVSPVVDLDLYVYAEDYVYFEEIYALQGSNSPYILKKSVRANPGIESGSESVSLAGLAAGCYMINVKARTTNNDGTDKLTSDLNNNNLRYNLRNDGGLLCPQGP